MLSWNWCRMCWTSCRARRNTRRPSRSSMHRYVLTSVLCGALLAQQQPPAAAPPPTSTHQDPDLRIVVGVDYVSTPAWVYDRSGNTVSGLRPEQFRLFDNGKE